MSEPVSTLPSGLAASHVFGKRAARVASNAALYQLVEELARAVDELSVKVGQLLERLA